MSIFEIRSFLGLAGYYRRCEDGLKFSIRGRIVGFRLRDMDSMVGTTLSMEREIEDTWNTRDRKALGRTTVSKKHYVEASFLGMSWQ